MINMKGEVVGINTAIFSRGGGNIGIGFTIPINLVKELLPQLKEKGKVTRGWLGVAIQRVTPAIAESLGLGKATGALVADVTQGAVRRAAQQALEDGRARLVFSKRTLRKWSLCTHLSRRNVDHSGA